MPFSKFPSVNIFIAPKGSALFHFSKVLNEVKFYLTCKKKQDAGCFNEFFVT